MQPDAGVGDDRGLPFGAADEFAVVYVDALIAARAAELLGLLTGAAVAAKARELIPSLLAEHNGDVALDAVQCERIAVLLRDMVFVGGTRELADFFFAQMAHAVFNQPR